MTLFSKSYSYISSSGVKVLCVIKRCCVYFLKNRSVVGTYMYIEYTQKALKVLLLSTPKNTVRVMCEFIFCSGQLFFLMMYKQKWSLRSVVKIVCPCATPLGTYFPKGNLVLCTYQKKKGSDTSDLRRLNILPVAPVAYQLILEPGIVGQFREFEPRRVHTRINSLGLFLVDKLTCGKRESVS